MTKMNKTISMFCVIAIFISVFALPASAYAWTDSFRVYKNGGAVLTNAVPKWNGDNYFKMNIKPDSNVSDAWAQGTEMIYARARDTGNNYASNLVSTRYAGVQTPTYYSGYGVFGYSYKLAAQYANSNPYQYAALTINWEP